MRENVIRERGIRIRDAIQSLGKAYGRQMGDDIIDIYRIALSDVSIDALERGVASAIRLEPWMPPPAVLRKHCGSGDTSAKAKEAWRAVLAAARRYGAYAKLDAEPMVAAAINRIGGWALLCRTDERDLAAKGRVFVDELESLMRDGLQSYDTSVLTQDKPTGRVETDIGETAMVRYV